MLLRSKTNNKKFHSTVVAASLCTAFSTMVFAHPMHPDRAQHLPVDHRHSTLAQSQYWQASLSEYQHRSTSIVNTEYLFEGDVADESTEYDLHVLGEAESLYVDRDSSQAFSLEGRTWLEVPSGMPENLQLDDSFKVSVDFYFRDTGEDESVRVILSNKDWAYDVPGLKITAFNEKVEWQPEGIIFAQFNIGVGTQEIATRFFDLPMDQWHTATVDIDFQANTVAFGINGREVIKSLTESEGGEVVDPSQFISWMAETPLRVGVHQSADGEDPEWQNEYDIANGNGTTSNLAQVYIDNLIIQSPKPDGDVGSVTSALSAFTDHLTGQAPLDDLALDEQLVVLRQSLDGTDFADFATQAKAFVDAHESVNGAIYEIENRNNLDSVYYDELPAVSRAYIDLGVWLMTGGLNASNVSSGEGLTYIEHTEWPGALAANAERVSEGTADIRAQFVRDPAYLMGGMRLEPDSELAAHLYRPTGFHAPAGELVTITVPQSVVDSGLHVRIGSHVDNHMALSSTSRFPVLSVNYRIESTSFQVVSPFGGNIYVLVPQDTDLGWVKFEFDGAVRAPYFSTREGYETDVADWETIRTYPGVFADLESDKFMVSVPSSQLLDFNQPVELLDRWDEIMDILQTLHGRPFVRSRAEAYVLDATQLVVGSFPGGYPVTPGLYAEGENGITDGYYTPFAALNDKSWEEDTGMLIMLHELGHHHYGRFILEGEQEAYVNVPAAAVLNLLYGLDYDEALKYSGYQEFSRTDAAIDWMMTYNFLNGNPIGYNPNGTIETSYQARGHAKFVDLADIFNTWDVLGDIYETYYNEDLASGNPANTQVGVTHDAFLEDASNAIGCNLASLFHFWGIVPSDELATTLSAMSVCDGALERVEHYLDSVPRTNEDLREFHTAKVAVHENQLDEQVWAPLLADFDQAYSQQVKDAGALIFAEYFGLSADGVPSTPVPIASSVNYDPQLGNDVHFGWKKSVDPEGKPLLYSWVLKDADSGEALLSRSWVDGYGVTIDGQDFANALQSYIVGGGVPNLEQVVTTSDTFTVVQSSAVVTAFTTDIDSDADGLSDAREADLGTDANVSDSDGDGLTDGEEVNLYGTDPLRADTDGDGFSDGDEVAAGTSPTNADEFPNNRVSTHFDYDGDRSADIAVRRPSTGTQFIKRSSDDVIQRLFFGSQPSDVPVSGDFDGDSINDIAVFRPSEGRWFIKLSESGDIQRFVFGNQSGDMPVPADYDGDGITDIAIRRPSTGQWIIRQSSDPSNYLRVTFGTQVDDIPIPADYDGDSRADIAVRRPGTGQWIYKQSSNNAIVRFYFGGQAGDIPLPADYDGDGKIDFAVRRPSTGMWFVRQSSNEQTVRTFFGSLADDIPVPADYDGDGITDLAFRRPSTRQTIYALSSDNNQINRLYFGSQSTDIPLAAPLMTRLDMAGFYSSDSANVISNDKALENEGWEIDNSAESYHEVLPERLELEVIYDEPFQSKPERVFDWHEKVEVERIKPH